MIAIAQLVEYIEECRSEGNIHVFKLAELNEIYFNRLKDLGENVPSRIHSIYLRERILINVTGLQAHKQGRDVLLAFDDDVGIALMKHQVLKI